MKAHTVLALNSGSSSLKYGWFLVTGETIKCLREGAAASLKEIVAQQAAHGLPAPHAIGHRFVHGGLQLHAHCLIDETVRSQLHSASVFAPLHTHSELALLDAATGIYPDALQVACFDTVFHTSLPAVARTLPLPQSITEGGLQRFGFHGLAVESIVAQLRPKLPPRVIVAHLGSGASITALRDGRSIDTTMGLTPSGGLMMATRSGDLDPGVLLYLMRDKQLDAEALTALIDQRSGLLGVSGVSGDLRVLHPLAANNPAAALAIAMFSYSVRKHIAAMIAVLEGIDLLVFSGGIGENDAALRATVCAGLRSVGVRLDTARNRRANGPLQARGARCAVRIVRPREERQIAQHVGQLLRDLPDTAPIKH